MKKTAWADLLLLLLLPLVLVAVTESIHRGSFSDWMRWMAGGAKQGWTEYALAFGVLNMMYLFGRKPYLILSALLLPLFAAGAYASRVKVTLRGEPLLPWDLQLGQEAANISSQLQAYMPSALVLAAGAVLFAGVLAALFFLLPKKKYRPVPHLSVGVLSLALALVLITNKPVAAQEWIGLNMLAFNQNDNYAQNGFLLGFAMNTKWLKIEQPAGYSPETIRTELAAAPKQEGNGEVRPNIIFVMSEAFWDPTVMENVKFDRDPVPFFHELQKWYTSGTMMSPVYGGSTANTEFEVLTGFSMNFLPGGSLPYSQYVHRPIDTLASTLKEQGYKSTAVHSFHNWFYRRHEVYQLMGFHNFISGEFFEAPQQERGYIADQEVADRILQEVRNSEEPDFVYAVTMQNHGPYAAGEYERQMIKSHGPLSETSAGQLDTYAQGLMDADRSLERLVRGLEESGEPSVVVFFGDHLPMLGNDYQVYREAGYFADEGGHAEHERMFGVPFVIWDNFSGQKENLRLSPSMLGPYVLNRAEKEGTAMTDYLWGLHEDGVDVIPQEQYLADEGVAPERLNGYRWLQYDLLFGEQYAYADAPSKPQGTEGFYLGSRPIELKGAKPRTLEDGTPVLGIKGSYFPPGSRVYLNGEAVPANQKNDHILLVELPDTLAQQGVELALQVKVLDTMNKEVAVSNEIKAAL